MTRAVAKGLGNQLEQAAPLMQLSKVDPNLLAQSGLQRSEVLWSEGMPICQEMRITCCAGNEVPTRLICFPQLDYCV